MLPTNEKEVKLCLRDIGHPICYFGEDTADRRERIKSLCTQYLLKEGKMPEFPSI